MAFTRPAGRLLWLLTGPLLLQSALPAAALEASAKWLDRSAQTLLAQAPGPAAAAIPTEVQGWVDGAEAAYKRGDRAEALRLQKQVVEWVQANRPALDVFRARALIKLGSFLGVVGQYQEALAPTEEAVRILRQLEGRQPEAPAPIRKEVRSGCCAQHQMNPTPSPRSRASGS
jgi:tetratricopeptide (TPR) repeat protein